MPSRIQQAKAKDQGKWQTWKILAIILFPLILIGIGILLSQNTRSEKLYYQSLSELALALPHVSEHGCVVWSGKWDYTSNEYSGVYFAPSTVRDAPQGCAQAIDVSLIQISTKQDSEAAALIVFKKEWNVMIVADFVATHKLPFKPQGEELTLFSDGLAVLSLSIEDQQATGINYGELIHWDGESMPQCKEVRAINKLSEMEYILPGGVGRLVTLACGQ